MSDTGFDTARLLLALANGEETPHETPHFKEDGSCDCFCDFCLELVLKDKYKCICVGCNGKCDSPHE